MTNEWNSLAIFVFTAPINFALIKLRKSVLQKSNWKGIKSECNKYDLNSMVLFFPVNHQSTWSTRSAQMKSLTLSRSY